jgi:RNA-directed DNA polymerase
MSEKPPARGYPRFEDAFSVPALHAAYRAALRGHHRDPEAAAFTLECGPRLCALHRAVLRGSYVPGPMRTFAIRDPKPREVVVVPFVDRVLHHALVAALEPVVEPRLDPDSYACRKGKGLHRAVTRAQALLCRHPYALQMDVRHYFAALPHRSVLDVLAGAPFRLPARYLALVHSVLNAGTVGRTGAVSVGMPIGALTSQVLGNIALHPVEAMLRGRFADVDHVRYMISWCLDRARRDCGRPTTRWRRWSRTWAWSASARPRG